MSFWAYIKDRFLTLLISCIAAFFAGLLMSTLGIGGYAVWFISTLYILGTLLALGLEYARRRSFYRDALETLDLLDKKYLLSETLEEPNSLEGKICFEILTRTQKSMNDEIMKYKLASKEFREYAEAWMHEIKTPIASSLLIAENHPSPAMKSITEELRRIDALVEQSMFYARSNSVEQDYIIRRISLEELVKSSLKKQSSLLIESRCSIQRDNLAGEVYTDIKWTDFILGQIFINAVKYASGPLVLSITGSKNTNSYSLRIQDNGIGIPSQDLPRIFEKGFTGSNGRGSAKSSGMGLYLCKKLCDAMGLGISVSSQLGRGTCVELVFPSSTMHRLEPEENRENNWK